MYPCLWPIQIADMAMAIIAKVDLTSMTDTDDTGPGPGHDRDLDCH